MQIFVQPSKILRVTFESKCMLVLLSCY